MAILLEESYGKLNKSDLISGAPLSKQGLRLIDYSDDVGPEHSNRPLIALLNNDNAINNHLNQITSLFTDGVFPAFGNVFNTSLSGTVNNTSMKFIVKDGLAKVNGNVYHHKYKPETTYEWDISGDGQTVQTPIPPVVTVLNIDVSNIGPNEYRRDLVVMNSAGDTSVVTGQRSSVLPPDYSQVDAPANSIAISSILFRKVSGASQTPVVNYVYNSVKINNIGIIDRLSDLMGNGIFRGDPSTESDITKKELYPELTGNIYRVNRGSLLINSKLIELGPSGLSITLNKSTTTIGTGSTPGATQGSNTNGWELVDFTSTGVAGAGGVGSGNEQFLKFDNAGKTAFIDVASVKIYTAAATGENGYNLERTFNTNILSSQATSTEEYAIDLTNGKIKRLRSTAPQKVFIKYVSYRHVRYLPYVDSTGTLKKLASQITYPAIPAEFTESDIPDDAVAIKSIFLRATESILRPENFGLDFRTFIDFVLEDGKINASSSIKNGSITGDKLASGAINNQTIINSGVITQSHLSDELKNFLSTSIVFARKSLMFPYKQSPVTYTFVDNTDGNNSTLTKNISDLSGNYLDYGDAELQNPDDRVVLISDKLADNIYTGVTVDRDNTKATFVLQRSNVGNIFDSSVTSVEINSVSLSFADFSQNQVGQIVVSIYDRVTGDMLISSAQDISVINNAINASDSTFYNFQFSAPVDITFDKEYEIKVEKTLNETTDGIISVYVNTSVDGPNKFANIAYKLFYKAEPGKYLTTNGYRLYDEFGDITVADSRRLEYGNPERYIPYAAKIDNPETFVVFENVVSSNEIQRNYVAVDVVKGIVKFSDGMEPYSKKIYADFNIVQGLNQLSSARIHRYNGLTVEHTLRTFETELGVTKANVRNELESLYYVGNGKFRFSSTDRQLTDINGNDLIVKDGNLQTPIHVIDRQYAVPEGRGVEKEVDVNFSDSMFFEFSPRFGNVAIIAINVVNPGYGFNEIQINLYEGEKTAGSFNTLIPVSTSTIQKSAIAAGLNFFTFNVNVDITKKYHGYIKINGYVTAPTSIKPKVVSDVINDNVEFYEYFLPESGKYGTINGVTIFDKYGDLNLGSEERGSHVDYQYTVNSISDFDDDGAQVQENFDDSDIDPANANTAFPVFTPTKPSSTGMVRFDIYFKTVPGPGEDGYNGVFRLALHDSNNNAIVPQNAFPGQDYIDVKIPKTAGWYEVPFIASLEFGKSYHMHIWGNKYDLKLYVATHRTTNKKLFRYVAGDRSIVFGADLSGDRWDEFEITTSKMVAVDVTNGRIKFNPDDLISGNRYYGNFNILTKSRDLQSDTIIRPNGETIENAIVNTVNVRNSNPVRVKSDIYMFNKRKVKLSDQYGRILKRIDGELPLPYSRTLLRDTEFFATSSISPTEITTNETVNSFSFFIDNYEDMVITGIDTILYDVNKETSYDVFVKIYESDTNNLVKTAYIKAADIKNGLNHILFYDQNDNDASFTVTPRKQYVMNFMVNETGEPGKTTYRIKRSSNNSLTINIHGKPVSGGFYGTDNGVVISDEFGDISKFNFFRDVQEIHPTSVSNAVSGSTDLSVKYRDDRVAMMWNENGVIVIGEFDKNTNTVKNKSQITDVSGVAYNPSMCIYENVAMVAWDDGSGSIYGRRYFFDEANPLSVDSGFIKLNDSGSINARNPHISINRNKLSVVWEDGRNYVSERLVSGDPVPPTTVNSGNIFFTAFNNVIKKSMFDTSVSGDNWINYPVKLSIEEYAGSVNADPVITTDRDYAVVIYSSNTNNAGIQNNVMLSVVNTDSFEIIRNDIVVDRQDVESDFDSITPKISSYKNKHAVTWLGRKDTESVYNVYGKIYNTDTLTFDNIDRKISIDAVSGVACHNVSMSDRIVNVTYITPDGKPMNKRYDVNTFEPHDDPYGWSFDFDGINPSYTDATSFVDGKKINTFALTDNSDDVIFSVLDGQSFEPFSTDLSDADNTDIESGFIGIDVEEGIFKFAREEEI